MEKFSEKVIKEINVTAQQAWKVISSVGGVDKWFPSIIKTCRVEGNKRYCETQDGSSLNEDIIEVNNETKTFVYGIPSQEMLPVKEIIGTMKVNETNNGNAEIEWSGTFIATKENAQIAKEAFKGLWTMGIEGLETYINSKN